MYVNNDPLKIDIQNEILTISMGTSTLIQAIEKEWGGQQIINHENFLKDFIKALVRIDTDGNTLITTTLSTAAKNSFNLDEKKDEEQWWIVKNENN